MHRNISSSTYFNGTTGLKRFPSIWNLFELHFVILLFLHSSFISIQIASFYRTKIECPGMRERGKYPYQMKIKSNPNPLHWNHWGLAVELFSKFPNFTISFVRTSTFTYSWKCCHLSFLLFITVFHYHDSNNQIIVISLLLILIYFFFLFCSDKYCQICR